jgi:autotransporter-associated beta strand protein
MNRIYTFCGHAARLAAAGCLKVCAHLPRSSIALPLKVALSSFGLAAALILLFVGNASGASLSWTLPTGQTGDWSIASNWSLHAIPTSSDNAYIDGGGKAAISLTGAVCSQLFLGGLAGPGNIQMTGGLLTSSSQSLGNSDYGAFVQSGGTNQIGDSLVVGNSSYGSYSLSGKAILSASNTYVGLSAQATFNHTSGTLSVTNLNVINGTYNLSGNALLSASNGKIGVPGQGTFNQTGGTATFAFLNLASGEYDLSGNSQLSSSYAYVGDQNIYRGTGPCFFDQSGGTNTVAVILNIGRGGPGTYSAKGNALLSTKYLEIGNIGTPSNFAQSASARVTAYSVDMGGGTYTLSDSALLSTSLINVGGSFVQSGGTNVITSSLTVGNISSNPNIYGDMYGTYTLSGNALLLSSAIFVGVEPRSGYQGDFIQSGGTNQVVSLYVGYDPFYPGSSDSSYSLAGKSLISATNTFVSGTFIQSGGTHAIAQNLYVGYGVGSYSPNGVYSINGESLLSASSLYVGSSGTPSLPGMMTQSGGTVSIQALSIGNGSRGTYNLNGGDLVLSTLTFYSNSAAFNFNGGTIHAAASFSTSAPLSLNNPGGNATIDTGGYSVTLSGRLIGPGNLIKSGSGKLILSGTNTYTGGTTVLDGTLVVSNQKALADGSDLTIGNAAAFPAPILISEAVPVGSAGSPVPEPSTFELIAAVSIAVAGYGWRRSRAGSRARELVKQTAAGTFARQARCGG